MVLCFAEVSISSNIADSFACADMIFILTEGLQSIYSCSDSSQLVKHVFAIFILSDRDSCLSCQFKNLNSRIQYC